MLGNSPFYNKTLKNVVAAFGAIFNDLQVVRVTPDTLHTQTVAVPLTYGSADKAFSRRTEDSTLNYNFMQVFPRMSFYMDGLSYDPSRKITAAQFASKNNMFAFSPAPYNVEFSLYLATANIEDGLQIIEQIIPFFNPEFTISTKAMPSLGLEYDVPIILNSVSYNDPAMDSEYTEARVIEWTLTFTAKTYIMGPVRTRAEIKHTNLKIFQNLPFGDPTHLEDVKADVVLASANETDPHVIVESIVRERGK